MLGNLYKKRNPMVRVFALGRLNTVLKEFTNKPPNQLDQKLLRGFYVRNKKDYFFERDGRRNAKAPVKRISIRLGVLWFRTFGEKLIT